MGIMKRLALLLVLLLPAAAGAQMFKCRDAAGKITYSSQACKDIGLTDAGEVRDSVTVVPATPVPAQPKPGAAKPAAPKPAAASMAPEAEKKDEPERRCFTVKTAKGVVTRCNDKPEEEEAKK
jgi:hypothetical protein